MALTSANILYGPFALSLRNSDPAEVFGITGLDEDFIKFEGESKEGNRVLEDGTEKFWLKGRKLKIIVEATQLDAKTGSITAFADGGGGTVTVTSAGHGLANGDFVTISGTTNYNGWFEVSSVATDTFKITDTWVSDDGTGTWVRSIHTDIESSTIADAQITLSDLSKTITVTTEKIFCLLLDKFRMQVVIYAVCNSAQDWSDIFTIA